MRKMDALTVEMLREVIRYEPESGRFFDRKNGSEIAGAVVSRDGYRQLRVSGVDCVSRRLALAWVNGEWPVHEVGYRDATLPFPARDRLSNIAMTVVSGDLTADQLREIVDYDPATGVFTWKTPRRGVRVGARAGSVDSNGYRYVPIRKQWYLAQRLAWLYVKGTWPQRMLRFVNDDADDCRIDNLREAEIDWGDKAQRNAAEKARRKARPEVYRQQDLRKSFGIGLAEYQAMHDAQNGCCAICGLAETETRDGRVKWLAVDHCHDSDLIRGLLCASCNMGLGKFSDDPARLRAAAGYLERHAAMAAESEVA